jgi:hypothetical protein
MRRMRTMRALVAGSRDWEGINGEARIVTILNTLLAFADSIDEPLTIVHGACPTGADAITDRWCRRREDQVFLVTYPAEWGIYGKEAGPIRNREMVDQGADVCLVFMKNASPGSSNTVALARGAGIPTFIIRWEECE